MPNRLLRRRWAKPDDAMPLTIAREIVEAYGRLLESHAELQEIHDAADLPYPKRDIKRAIRVLLRAPAHKVVQPILRRSYLLLANWQNGVDAQRSADAARSTVPGDSAGCAECSPESAVSHWRAVAQAEREALRRELDRF